MTSSPSPGLQDYERPLFVLRLALWFGLAAGACELALLALRKYALHHLVFLSIDALWMVPLADAVLFIGAGIVLVAARAVLPGRIALPVVALLGALAVFTPLLMYEPLYRPAAAVLALGAGAAMFRLTRPRMQAFDALVRRTLPLLVVAVLVAGGVARTIVALAERAHGAAAPARAQAPNVLLIVLDTVRSSHLSVYGYGRSTTPQMQRWLRDGVRFEHALATVPWTLPSHASLFTGRFPHELSADWLRPLDEARPTLAEMLVREGYATAGFVANARYCSRETGLARGFSHYEDYPVSAAQIAFSSSLGRLMGGTRFIRRKLLRKSAEDVNAQFLRWLDARPATQPFFVFLNYLDAHSPYQPPGAFSGRFSSPGAEKLVEGLSEDDAGVRRRPEVRQAAIDKYDESLAYLDDELGRLFAELERRGLWNDMLVVVTSDHGEEFGERGVYYHGNSLYRGGLEVPLLLRFPKRIPAGARIATPVSLKDLGATVLDVAGLQAALPGRSLARFWQHPDADSGIAREPLLMELGYAPGLPEGTPIARGSMHSVLLDDLRLIRNGDGREELFDFARDPTEAVDLAARPEHQQSLRRLGEALDALAPNARPRR